MILVNVGLGGIFFVTSPCFVQCSNFSLIPRKLLLGNLACVTAASPCDTG